MQSFSSSSKSPSSRMTNISLSCSFLGPGFSSSTRLLSTLSSSSLISCFLFNDSNRLCHLAVQSADTPLVGPIQFPRTHYGERKSCATTSACSLLAAGSLSTAGLAQKSHQICHFLWFLIYPCFDLIFGRVVRKAL